MEVLPLSAIFLHVFCYLHLEFVYQNLLHLPQASLKWINDVHYNIWYLQVLPFLLHGDNNAELFLMFPFSLFFQVQRKPVTNHCKRRSARRYCKNNLHSFIHSFIHLKIFFMTHLKIYMKNTCVRTVTAWSRLRGMKKMHHYFYATFLQQEQVFANTGFKMRFFFHCLRFLAVRVSWKSKQIQTTTKIDEENALRSLIFP